MIVIDVNHGPLRGVDVITSAGFCHRSSFRVHRRIAGCGVASGEFRGDRGTQAAHPRVVSCTDKRLVNEIESAGKFGKSRGRPNASTMLAAHLATLLACAVRDLPSLDAGSAARLTEAVCNSAFVQDGKDMTSRTIDEKLMSGGVRPYGDKEEFIAYDRCSAARFDLAITAGRHANSFTAQERDFLNGDRASTHSNLQATVDRLFRSGLRNPRETTFWIRRGNSPRLTLHTLAAAQAHL